jgi:uncharacterized protein YcbK (DUF882 family)
VTNKVIVGATMARSMISKGEAGIALLLRSHVSPNFAWAEVFHNRTLAQILLVLREKEDVLANAVATAREMETVRARLGNKPIKVTSWWRDRASNKANGGAPRSQHLLGKAVDFTVAGMSPAQVQRACEWWPGGMGYGLAFTHLDTRSQRARFNY